MVSNSSEPVEIIFLLDKDFKTLLGFIKPIVDDSRVSFILTNVPNLPEYEYISVKLFTVMVEKDYKAAIDYLTQNISNLFLILQIKVLMNHTPNKNYHLQLLNLVQFIKDDETRLKFSNYINLNTVTPKKHHAEFLKKPESAIKPQTAKPVLKKQKTEYVEIPKRANNLVYRKGNRETRDDLYEFYNGIVDTKPAISLEKDNVINTTNENRTLNIQTKVHIDQDPTKNSNIKQSNLQATKPESPHVTEDRKQNYRNFNMIQSSQPDPIMPIKLQVMDQLRFISRNFIDLKDCTFGDLFEIQKDLMDCLKKVQEYIKNKV
jgi:hypothetical protein